jgi:two-component system OmpR family response regulator
MCRVSRCRREPDLNGPFSHRSGAGCTLQALRLLVVEDEPTLAAQVAAAARGAGYAVDCAHDGPRADFLARTETYDAVILDLGLPGVDGLSLLRAWREADLRVPVLILTARGSWHEKVLGIDGGADDYVSKPFEMAEVLARVRALIRRAGGHARPVLSAGALVLDPGSARVTLAGTPVRISAHEFRVLSYLMHHQPRVVPRAELSEHIYELDLDRDSNTVEVFVARLRRKLGASAIETVRGVGYRMGIPGQSAQGGET